MNISFDPQEIVVSALAPVLDAEILNPVGRDIIQGMDYESGKWTENGNTHILHHSFSRAHKNPPCMFMVHASRTNLAKNTMYGQLFINYYRLLGIVPMVAPISSKYGMNVLWTVTSSTSSILQGVTTITSMEMLNSYATNEYFVFGDNSVYIRDKLVYNWIAAFMPE